MWIENETCVPKCEGEALSSIPTTEKMESYATLDKSSTWNAVWEFSELFVFLLETHIQAMPTCQSQKNSNWIKFNILIHRRWWQVSFIPSWKIMLNHICSSYMENKFISRLGETSGVICARCALFQSVCQNCSSLRKNKFRKIFIITECHTLVEWWNGWVCETSQLVYDWLRLPLHFRAENASQPRVIS